MRNSPAGGETPKVVIGICKGAKVVELGVVAEAGVEPLPTATVIPCEMALLTDQS